MKIKFDTAIFGERDKAHSILSSSLPELARTLIAVTDLPLDLPVSSGNSPMLSGFPHEGKYVFLSSIRDANAARGGMAKTAALITDLGIVSKIECLDSVIQNLDHNLPHFASAETVECEAQNNLVSVNSPGTVNLVRALIASKNSQSVVWIGEEGFRESLNGLWRGLPAALKRTFTFRYSCTPRDGRIKSTDLILTPLQFRSRWKEQLVVQAPFSIPETQAERYFSDDSIREAVLKWSKDLSVDVASFETLSLMTDTQELFQRIDSISDLEVTVLFRNLARLTPSPGLGAGIKKRVVNELQSRIKAGPMDMVGYLRNVQANEFDGAFDAIRVATQKRYARAIAENDESCLKLTRQAIIDNARPWAIGLLEAFADSLRVSQPIALQLYWTLITTFDEASVRTWIALVAQAIPNFEQTLIDSMPASIAETDYQSVGRFCKQQNWATLHAIVVSSALSPRDAIAEQLHFAQYQAHGFSELSRRLGSRVFVDAALSVELVDLLISQLVDDCISDVQLFDMFSVAHNGWRRVLRAVVAKSSDIFNETNVLDVHVEAIWQLNIEGRLKDNELINALCRTRYANLLDANHRQLIWESLSVGAREVFCNATARAWIERAGHIIAGLDRPEPALASEILTIKHRETLLPVTGESSVAIALRAFTIFPELTQFDFDAWRVRLLTMQRSLSMTSAQLIGSQIAKRGWKMCAEGLLSDYTKYARNDLYPALCECSNLFGWLTKFRYSLSKDLPTPEQWWQELENILVYLYPEGPSDKNFWERADGRNGDLRLSKTGREQWVMLLAELRKGKDLGDATINTLLRECFKDYAANADLRLLIEKAPFKLKLLTDDAFID